jgi:hypothetical protein
LRPLFRRKAARILGLVWMIGIVAGGIVLLAAGRATGIVSGSGRGAIYLLFAAMLPGILAWRWGNASKSP